MAVDRSSSSIGNAGARRLASAVAIFVIFALGLATTGQAQRLVPETPGIGGGSAGVGGGPGLIGPLPPVPPAMQAPTLSPSIAVPQPAPPIAVPAAPAPAAPARVIRFRCELAPQAEACKEPGAPDGGGDDGECSCDRDYCHTNEAGIRVCEKLQ
jgi:hypothetical protein